MQLAALAGEQIVVQRLAQERVPEREPVVVARHQHLLGDRFAQRRLERLRVDAGDRTDHRLVEAAADRDRAGGALRLV